MNLFVNFREIFTKVADAILAEHPTCRITNTFVYAPPEYPCAAIVLSDDGTREDTRDSSKQDKFRNMTVVVDVFSNKTDGKKTEAEAIMQIAIDTLLPLNFNMVSCKPNSNINNATNYKITATFIATIDSNGTLYRR